MKSSRIAIYFVEVQFQAKEKFYRRLLAEIFAYHEQYEPENNWQAVAIFASRNLEPQFPDSFAELRPKLRVVYLDEISRGDDLPISLGIVKLAVTSQEQVQEVLPGLLEKLQQQIIDQELERRVFEFIETILLYKFTNLSREEIEAMFSLSDLKESKVYQEAKAEGKAEGELLGKLKAVMGLLSLGLSVQQVALALELEIVMVEQVEAGTAVEDIVQEFLRQGAEII